MTQRDDDQHTADEYAWHMNAISDVLQRWRDGDLTTYEKRKAIAGENRYYYADRADPWMLRLGRRYELPGVLAEAAGVPEDVMVIALNARRHGGAEAFGDVLGTAIRRRT